MSQAIGSPAVISRLHEDLYISAVRISTSNVSIRAFVEPMVAWVWVGGFLLVLGSLIAGLPRPRRKPEET
jgi:cytochrome c-type biogenesis protein CcmF